MKKVKVLRAVAESDAEGFAEGFRGFDVRTVTELGWQSRRR